MNNYNKFYLIIFLILCSSFQFQYRALVNTADVKIADKIPEQSSDYEKQYSDYVCFGYDNIVKAGCAVISGQVVRGIPAMAFGASFDKMKDCIKKAEDWKPGQSINLNDSCNQLGLMNPKINRNDFVLDPNGPDNDPSINGIALGLENLNTNIAKNAFDNSFYAYKGVENIPVAKEAFAQDLSRFSTPSGTTLYGIGEPLRWIVYNSWVIFRNVAYALIGLLSIVLGITLMSSNSFLDNNAKWRLSLEQAIPRVIISVILIQFSYTIGEALLFIANNENFIPLFNYMFGVNPGQEVARGFLIYLIGIIMVAIPGPIGISIMLLMVVLGLWYLYRLIIVWWQSFNAIFGIFFITILSPILIAISLLPGEAGALQLRRYFSTLISLLSQTLLYQLIKVGPAIFAVLFYSYTTITTWNLVNNLLMFVPGYAAFMSVIPLIIAIIILQRSDGVLALSNDFAKNVTGADPIGAQQQQR